MSILRTENLSVTLDGRAVLREVNFELGQGDHLAVIGPNGSGKTVLLKALLGLIPHSGNIVWQKDARLGYVPQKIEADRHLPLNSRNLLEAKAAFLNLQEEETNEVIRTVGLPGTLLETPVGHLSGGEFQKLLIAFALLGKPNVLLLDEPTASIDKPGEERSYELIHRMQETYGVTVVLVSHDLSLVYRYATNVLCLNQTGVCFGAPEAALTPEVLQKLYGPAKLYHTVHDHGHK